MRVGTTSRWGRRTTICEQGRKSGEVHIMLFGKVLRECADVEGERTILDVHGRGEVLGAIGLLDGGVEPHTIRTHTRTSALTVSYENFRAFLRKHPEARAAFDTQMARRYRHDTARATSLATERVEVRIRRMLVDLATRFGVFGDVRGLLLDLGLTRAELAALAGTTLETVIRTAHRLRDQGLLVTDGRRFFIPDMDKFRP